MTTTQTARTYVPRPVTIEAVEWTGNLGDLPGEWLRLDMFEVNGSRLQVRTLEGLSEARVGDFVVRGTAGEFYPVRRPIFLAKYEEVS